MLKFEKSNYFGISNEKHVLPTDACVLIFDKYLLLCLRIFMATNVAKKLA